MDNILRAGSDRGYSEAVNMEDELFACCDGHVYPITNWFGVDCEPCAKEDAAVAVAGRCFVWFTFALASFGIGPLANMEETTDALTS